MSKGDVKNIKFYLAALIAREITGIMKPPAEKIQNIDSSNIDQSVLEKMEKFVSKYFNELSEKRDRDVVARGPDLIKSLDAEYKRIFSKPKRRRNEQVQ